MKANKVTVTIKTELLSIDSLAAMLRRVENQIESEVESGKLEMADGDQIEWQTERIAVEF